jgi:DNA-binding protein YbaB
MKTAHRSTRNMGDPLAISDYITQRIEDLKIDPDRGTVFEFIVLQNLIEEAMDAAIEHLESERKQS